MLDEPLFLVSTNESGISYHQNRGKAAARRRALPIRRADILRFRRGTVNAVVSKRFAKTQQMQWSKTGAHLLLQTRTQTLDGSLLSTFEKWYPGMGTNRRRQNHHCTSSCTGIERTVFSRPIYEYYAV